MSAVISERIAAVHGRIARAGEAAGRDPREVTLIAVSKTQPDAAVAAALEAGLVDLAENRVQELVQRVARFEDGRRVPVPRWHLIGRLQRNKVRDVVGRVALIHSVDRRELIDAISRHAQEAGVVQDVLVQVNVGDDPAKAGCHLDDLEGLVTYAAAAPAVRVAGLMTVPPLPAQGQDVALSAGPCFRRLREERDRLRAEFPTLEELSMGMSDDLEVAVQEGSTMVRIGSALFGARSEVV
jgi:PLP dependent protein